MPTTFLRVAAGEGSGQITLERVQSFITIARSRWHAVTIQAREFPEGPSGPWVGLLVSTVHVLPESEEQGEFLEEQLIAFLKQNGAPHYRSTSFGADLSFEGVLE